MNKSVINAKDKPDLSIIVSMYNEEDSLGLFFKTINKTLNKLKKYTYEMNKLFDSGVKVATSLRDIKNYNDSWISAGQGMSFYREHLLIHHSRSRLNIGTYISGTGFFVSKEIIDKFGGWKFNTMIEDIEFSIDKL